MRYSMRGALLGFAALGAGMVLAGGPATAQTTTGWPQETPGDALSRNLKSLAANPHSIDALTGAGRAALDVGDAQGALSFLARAEDEAPRDGRIKMWIGSALVQLEQPQAALKFFKDAAELGVPEGEIAKDRGLAHDILGDQRRAQRDYRLALQAGRNPEVTRRLALSLAISGEREQALRLLDDQLQTRNPAAERTRALVLALTGDAADAGRAVQASMPGAQGTALMPFLARLPSLSPADRALAVHLGHFPQDGRTPPASAYAANAFRANVVSAPSTAAFEAGRPDPLQPGLGRTTGALVRAAPPQQAEEASRRIPSAAAAQPAKVRSSAHTTSPARESEWSWSRGTVDRPQPRVAQPQRTVPVQVAAATPPRVPAAIAASTRPPAPAASAASAHPPASAQAPIPAAPPPAVLAVSQPVDIAHLGAAKEPAAEVAPPVAHPPADIAPAVPRSRIAELAAAVATLPSAPPPAARPGVSTRTAAAPKPGPVAESAKKKPQVARKTAPKEARHHWVQIGIGEDDEALPGEFQRLRVKAGKLLAARTAWTAPMGETNRILVGPFASKEDAQDFVNELAEKKLRAFAWTSPAGEKVAKLPTK
jgi:Flp pilus assembly protein TadD